MEARAEPGGSIPSNGSGLGGTREVEAELARYLPQLGRMGEQLKQTSKQIEDSVVGVCDSFQGIAATGAGHGLARDGLSRKRWAIDFW